MKYLLFCLSLFIFTCEGVAQLVDIHLKLDTSATPYKRGIYRTPKEMAANNPSILVPFTVKAKKFWLDTSLVLDYKILTKDRNAIAWGSSVWGFSDGYNAYVSVDGPAYWRSNHYAKLLLVGYPYSLRYGGPGVGLHFIHQGNPLALINLKNEEVILLKYEIFLDLLKPHDDLLREFYAQHMQKRVDIFYFIHALNERESKK